MGIVEAVVSDGRVRRFGWSAASAVSPLDTAKDIAVSVSALAAALLALLGVNAWRRQLKGQSEYQVALKALKAVYAARESLVQAREPLPVLAEEVGHRPGAGGKAEHHSILEAQSYQARLGAVRAARANLMLARQEALAIWGQRAAEALEDLVAAVDELLKSCGTYFEDEAARARRSDSGGAEVLVDPDHLVLQRILYVKPDREGTDPFGKRITRAVGKAEEFFRSRLG